MTYLYRIRDTFGPPSPEKTPSPGDRRLSTYSLLLLTKKWLDNGIATLPVGERWVNPLRDEASLKRSGNQKKKTRFAGLFFLTGLRPVLPLG